jgi:hypothetical protein
MQDAAEARAGRVSAGSVGTSAMGTCLWHGGIAPAGRVPVIAYAAALPLFRDGAGSRSVRHDDAQTALDIVGEQPNPPRGQD